MSALRLVLRVLVSVLAAGTLPCAAMGIGLLYHYFGPPDDFVEWLRIGTDTASLPGFVAIAIAIGGTARVHPVLRVVAGLAAAIGVALVVTFVAFVGSRPVEAGGQQSHLDAALQAFMWVAVAVVAVVLVWRAHWPGRHVRLYRDPDLGRTTL